MVAAEVAAVEVAAVEAAAAAVGKTTRTGSCTFPISMEVHAMKAPKSRKDNICRYPLAFFLIGLLMASVSAHHASGATAKVKQRTFASPEEASRHLLMR